MKTCGMKRAVLEMLVATFPLVGVMGQPADAVSVIGFEDLYPGSEAQSIPIPSGYEGFTWSSDFLCITKFKSPGSGYEYGTIGRVSAYTAWANNISMDGQEFDFLGAYVTAAWNSGQDFTVEGWRSGSRIYSSYQVTSYDQPYWFDFDFYNVDTVWFKPGSGGTNAGLGGSGHHLCIDNITIPEPATICLLGIGGLLLRRRRK